MQHKQVLMWHDSFVDTNTFNRNGLMPYSFVGLPNIYMFKTVLIFSFQV